VVHLFVTDSAVLPDHESDKIAELFSRRHVSHNSYIQDDFKVDKYICHKVIVYNVKYGARIAVPHYSAW